MFWSWDKIFLLKIWTRRAEQTVQTQIKLLLYLIRVYTVCHSISTFRSPAQSTTRLLGRLSPLRGKPVLWTFFRQKLTTALLESAEVMNDCRKYFMINFNKRMLPTSVTSWSPVGCPGSCHRKLAELTGVDLIYRHSQNLGLTNKRHEVTRNECQ